MLNEFYNNNLDRFYVLNKLLSNGSAADSSLKRTWTSLVVITFMYSQFMAF